MSTSQIRAQLIASGAVKPLTRSSQTPQEASKASAGAIAARRAQDALYTPTERALAILRAALHRNT